MVSNKKPGKEMTEETTNQETVKEQNKTENIEDKDIVEKKKVKKSKKLTKSKEIELVQQINELNDKFLRLYSEFDNYRKRTIKEKSELIKTATADVIISLLPIMDDCERAKKSLSKSTDINAVKEGMLLIFNKLKNILDQMGLEEMTSIGNDFNTDHHEAITNIPAPTEKEKGKVIDETEKGYFLNGKVIRYAKVIVGN